jgi:hypothetical protein
MAKRVTFECTCPQSVGDADIEREPSGKVVKTITCQKSGEKTVLLDEASYIVRIRAQGTPGTEFTLKVTKGGKMKPFEGTIRSSGATAGSVGLKVPEPDAKKVRGGLP